MATPYGHALLGLTLFSFWRSWNPTPGSGTSPSYGAYGLAAAAALLPDLDFLPGLLIGEPSRFHQGRFHSLGAVLALSLIFGALIARFRRGVSFLKGASLVFLLAFPHLLIDYFTEDFRRPYGFPLFWPFSPERFSSPVSLFPHSIRSLSRPDFWSQNLYCFLIESLFLIPLGLSFLIRRSAK